MNPFVAALIIVACAIVMVVVMLLVRRRSQPGGHFADSDRASGVFGFLGAGFVILLGFVIFLSFGTYDNARTQSDAEAVAVVDQFAAADEMPMALRSRAQAELMCYAKSVVGPEWSAMKDGNVSPVTEKWAVALEQTQTAFPEATNREATAAKDWAEATHERELGRRARLMVAEGDIPVLLWALLAVGAVLVVGFVLLYADPAEGAVAQGVMMGGVTVLVVASLLAVVVLASPFEGGSGSIEPVGMQYSIGEMQQELAKQHRTLPVLCDANGTPTVARYARLQTGAGAVTP